MHAPKVVVAISLASLLAACSKPKPHADESLGRDLDLALSTGSRGVVSAAELGAKPKPQPKAPAEQVHARAVKQVARATRPSIKDTAPVPQPAEVKPQPAEEVVAVAPTPAPVVVVGQAPEPTPQPQQSPEPQRNGGGGGRQFPGGGEGGFRIPGIGGVIIIRGGGSGVDPCDERMPHGGGRMGGGGVLMQPRAPYPGGIGGGWRFGR